MLLAPTEGVNHVVSLVRTSQTDDCAVRDVAWHPPPRGHDSSFRFVNEARSQTGLHSAMPSLPQQAPGEDGQRADLVQRYRENVAGFLESTPPTGTKKKRRKKGALKVAGAESRQMGGATGGASSSLALATYPEPCEIGAASSGNLSARQQYSQKVVGMIEHCPSNMVESTSSTSDNCSVAASEASNEDLSVEAFSDHVRFAADAVQRWLDEDHEGADELDRRKSLAQERTMESTVHSGRSAANLGAGPQSHETPLFDQGSRGSVFLHWFLTWSGELVSDWPCGDGLCYGGRPVK